MMGADAPVAAGIIVISHMLAAVLALGLGALVLLLEKGTARHRFFGRLWAGLMVFVALGSFAIGESFGWIHLLSVWVLFGMLMALIGIRRIGGIRGRRIHAGFMIGNYIGLWSAALPAALTEGRLLHQLIFG